MKKYIKLVCILLSFIFVFQLVVFSADYEVKIETDDERTTIVSEDLSKREKFEKHFICNDGSYMAVSYQEAVHRQIDGKWIEIDNSLRESNGRLQNNDCGFAVSFADTLNDKQLVSLAYNGYRLSWNMENTQSQKDSAASEVRRLNNDDYEKLSENEKKMAATKIQSSVLYENALEDDVDVKYTLSPEKVKEEIIIKEPTKFSSYTMNIFAPELTCKKTEGNCITFLNQKGDVVFIFEIPYMFDSADEVSYDIAVEVEETKEGYSITYIPDAMWLNSEKRVYPIVIDPSVTTSRTASNTHDTYVYSGCSASSSRAAEQKLYVGIKSGTVHRVFWKAINLPTISVPVTITNAKFYTRCWSGTSTSRAFSLYEATASWSENLISWSNMPTTTALITGVNRNTSNNIVTFSNAAITNVVRNYYNGCGTNNGFMVRYTNESTSNADYNSFYSSENTASSSYMPYITITYITPTNPIPNGYYKIRSLYSSKYLTVSTGNVVQYQDTGASTQKWHVVYQGSGYYSLTPSSNTGSRLNIQNSTDTNGTNVNIAANNGSNAQRFRIIAQGSNYRISPKTSTKRVLDVCGPSTANNANIQLWYYGGVSQQNWAFELISYDDPYSGMGWSYVFASAEAYDYITRGYKTTGNTDHKGIDLSSSGISGVAIKSPCKGTVHYKESGHISAGNYIVIESTSTDPTTGKKIKVGFMHMASPSPLSKGDAVSKGTVVGYVGSTGDSSGPHLHLCMWNTDTNWATMTNSINPQRFFPHISFEGDLSNVRP